ncbi:MAG TPA: hypothetical protein VMU08_07370, partial [Rhizomicrobium sp.]|nr:hypothetical protein [Rhizomicrobium sp.]
MTLSDLASLATLVSGIAVLVSLFYLSLQIRQNTRHSRALIHQGRAARMSDMALHLTEFRRERAIEQCFQGDPDAEPGALIRFYGYCRAYFVGIEDGFYHHR